MVQSPSLSVPFLPLPYLVLPPFLSPPPFFLSPSLSLETEFHCLAEVGWKLTINQTVLYSQSSCFHLPSNNIIISTHHSAELGIVYWFQQSCSFHFLVLCSIILIFKSFGVKALWFILQWSYLVSCMSFCKKTTIVSCNTCIFPNILKSITFKKYSMTSCWIN